MKLLSSISSIIPLYNAFILDLWGVIHDGSQLYSGVHETLLALRKSGKKIIFVSNAPRRAFRVAEVLCELGITSDLYDAIVSSGEVGFEWLKYGNSIFGKNYYFIGAKKDSGLLQGEDFVEVEALEQADFILNLGFGTDEQTAADFSELLENANKLQLPMLCLNPDLEVIKITGERFPCAGVLAKHYETIGGKVTWFGKPYIEVYEYAHKLLDNIDKNQILAVGDSLETDIAGAKLFGIASALVSGGILKDKTLTEIEEDCIIRGLKPNYITPNFKL